MACDFSEAILCSEAGSSWVHCKRNRVFSKPHTAWKMGLSLFRLPQRTASRRLFRADFKIQMILVKQMTILAFVGWTVYTLALLCTILYYLVFSFTWRKLRAHWYKYRYEHLTELSKCFMNAEAHGLPMAHLSWPSIPHSCGEQWFTQDIWCCLCTPTRWPK